MLLLQNRKNAAAQCVGRREKIVGQIKRGLRTLAIDAVAVLAGDVGEAFADLVGAAEHDRLDPFAQRGLRGPGIVPAIEQRARRSRVGTKSRAAATTSRHHPAPADSPASTALSSRTGFPASAAACSAATACPSE